ncbi:MAG TPA: 4a-hydroxytetrahydrobiopterin dehydratase [Burkholderiaceae bacterium]|mgnify:FL=1|nr:4a-hydroxytetrahydrobiopterin dehydratase [Burkholderiaceae bacterium]
MKAPIPRQQLLARKSRPIGGERAYTVTEIEAQLTELAGWSLRDGALERSYAFRDYYDTIAFVNALAWMVHGEDHHPDLLVTYNRCTVRFNTHSVRGISENDFICAAKCDAVFGRGGN